MPTTIKLGVTGGIGSGKTTVCEHLERHGAKVFYADVVARRLMQDREDVRAEICAAFGGNSYAEDGTLNRALLAAKAFGAPECLALLNAIVHPRVREAFEEMRVRARGPLLVYEAALIFETGGERLLDAVVVVDAPATDRIERVRKRDNVSEKQVRERMEHQLPRKELIERADYIIDNSGSLEALAAQVDRLFQDLTSGT